MEVGKTADLAARFECYHIVDAAGKMVLPGFIDAHNHPNQFLSKGIGDDVDVMTWLTRRVYPYEAHLTPDDSYIGALGNFIEMVRSGTTCFNDLGSYFPESVAAAAAAVGIRGVLNRSTRDLPEPGLDPAVVGKLFEDTQTALGQADEFVKRWHGAENDRFHAWYSLRYTISVTDELAVGIGELANRQGVGIHTHAAVGDYENEISLGRFGKRSLERLHDLGLFGPNLCLVHMGAPSPAEIELVKRHDVLLSGGRGSTKGPGEFRRSQNWIGGSRPGNATLVPPPPDRVLECMGQLEAFLHSRSPELPLLVRAALTHVRFETIHPFLDGNGRLGRLLITFLLCAESVLKEPILYLSLFFKSNRQLYYDLLQAVRQTGDWETWLDFFLTGVRETSDQAADTARQILTLFDHDRGRIEQLGRPATSALRVHQYLQTRPLASVPSATKELHLSAPTIRKSIGHLADLGIVREATGRQRGKLYAYDAYLDILSQGTEPL